MRKYIVILLFSITVQSVVSQEVIHSFDSIPSYFQRQLENFPQEKIYVQTDKSSYLSGESIRFRAHLVNAQNNEPIFISRYVYVEMISPMDNLTKRVKIRPDSTGAYHGYLDLDDDLPEGSYTLRAYTNYMRNMGEEMFFRKQIHVLDPFSLQLEPIVSFDVNKNNASATLVFIDRQNNDTIVPDAVSCKLSHQPERTLSPRNNNSYNWNVNLPSNERNRTMLLSLSYNGRKYNRYYTIPYDPSDFDVSFFPEGGDLVPDAISQVAFKALNPGGFGENISGTVFNSRDEEIVSFKSFHLGMGFFNMIPRLNETYYVVCQNENGISKRFNLPPANIRANSLSTRLIGSRLLVSVRSGNAAAKDSLSLLIHHNGKVLYLEPFNLAHEFYAIPSNDLPTGILNFLLLDSRMDVISERMLFNVDYKNLVNPEIESSKPAYKRREPVSLKLNLPESISTTTLASIAVSVTDMNTVVQDTTYNILSSLLLSSELRGHIESPASYLNQNSVNRYALDALMMTQGWRRYNIPQVLKGEIETPGSFEPEPAQEITGRAERLFGSLKEGEISLMASLDSLVSTEITQADDKGRFSFFVEYPEGTSITIQSLSSRGGRNNQINIHQQTFPGVLNTSIPSRASFISRNNPNQDAYLEKANEDYTQKFGIRTILLDELTVTAKSLERYKESSFYSPLSATGVYTAEDIEKMGVNSLRSLLYRQPGIIVGSTMVTTTRSTQTPVLFVIDNMTFEDFSDRLDDIDVSSIDNIFVVKDNSFMPGYYPNTNGAVVITTKTGFVQKPRKSLNIDRIIPLGYQQTAEFYSPKYETPEQKEASTPDLRTTIYWKPNVLIISEQDTLIEFYSADTPTTYQVIGEGVGNNGELIRFTYEIPVESTYQ
ncbi:MAG: TonB-dependent receptor [Bacteroidia bacterium]|nr:TonB-dependent receptor [Bacteroidia bacterium]